MKLLAAAKAVIFDFDDTLMATKLTRVPLFISALYDFGFVVSDRDVSTAWGRPFNQLVRDLAPAIDYDLFYKHYSRVLLEVPPQITPGADPLLAQLVSRGIGNFVLTSTKRALAQQDLAQGGLLKYIERIWGLEECEHHKPDPRVMAPAIAELTLRKIPIDSTVYVGDSIRDFTVASAASINFIAVLSGSDPAEEFLRAGLSPDHIITSLQELL